MLFPSFSHNVSCNYVSAISVATKPKPLGCQSKFCLEHECFLHYALLPIILPIAIVPSNLDVMIWTRPLQAKHFA
jgi:hypothetical protein